MKALIKYSLLACLYSRGAVFAVIFIMNTIFILLGSFNLLSNAAFTWAVALGGLGLAVMFFSNIKSNIAVAGRMFTAPKVYLYVLTPAPRWKILLANITAMIVMDLLTMISVILTLRWLAFNMRRIGLSENFNITIYGQEAHLSISPWFTLFLFANYLLVMMIILFCATAKKSIFFKLPASGFLAFLLACGCFYITNLLQMVLAPFTQVTRDGIFMSISFNETTILLIILLLILRILCLAGLAV